MKRNAVLGLLVGGAGVIMAWAVTNRPEEVAVEKLKDNLFVITGNGGNTAAFIHATGVVLVDTKVAGSGQRILDALRTITDKPITHILNTHTHHDHVGSNAFFLELVEIVPGVETVIPGHGAVATWRAFVDYGRMVRARLDSQLPR